MSAPRWWDCPVDAQRLAEESVGAVVAAVESYERLRGSPSPIATTPSLIRGAFEAIGRMRVDGEPISPWAEFSGFFAASDGYVRLHGNYPHHADAVRRALGAGSREELEAAISEMAASDVEDAVLTAGGIGTRVRTEAEWRSHPQHRATANDAWVSVERGGVRRRRLVGDLPLTGLRVLDLTRVIAGPTCTQLLACLGADVLRIDPPQRPELLDQYLSNGMGKRSVEIDLAERSIRDLLADADVVVFGYRPGSLARFGLGPEEIAHENPACVVASLSAWGEYGPWGSRAGFDSIVQAASGISLRCAGPDGSPGALPVQVLDFATGHRLTSGVIDLLAEDRGGIVRASLLGAARELLGYPAPIDTAIESGFEPQMATVTSPHGEVELPLPPLLVNGYTIENPISAYGTSLPRWAP